MQFDFHDLTAQLERTSTERITLRPVALSDAWPLYKATRNPQFMAHLTWPQPESEREVLRRIDMISAASRSGQLTALSAVVKESGEWISLFRFMPYKSEPDTLEMGIWTHPKFWGDNYSLELARLCISRAFTLTGVNRLITAGMPDNLASLKLMKHCGIMPIGLSFRPGDEGKTFLVQEHSLTREDWAARYATPFDAYVPEVPPELSRAPLDATAESAPVPAALEREAESSPVST